MVTICAISRYALLFGYFNYFPAFVFAATRAGAVRQLGLMTIGALGHTGRAQGIVRPAVGRSSLGVSSFGIWHVEFLNYVQFCSRLSAAQRSSAGLTS